MATIYYLIKTKFNQPESEKLEQNAKDSGLDFVTIEEGHDLNDETIRMLRNTAQIQYIPSLLALDDEDNMRIHEVGEHEHVKDFHVKAQAKLKEKQEKNGK